MYGSIILYNSIIPNISAVSTIPYINPVKNPSKNSFNISILQTQYSYYQITENPT